MPDRLLTDLAAFAAALRRGRAVNVNDGPAKDQGRALVNRYFADVRPKIVAPIGETAELLAHDGAWRRLLRLTQNNSARKSYLNAVASLRAELTEINVSAASTIMMKAAAARASGEAVQLSTDERLIITTLERILPSAAQSYLQGCRDLAAANRISYRGTATEFREALREVLDHFAPDAAVMAEEGFKLEQGLTQPTRRQKVKFILSSRRANKDQQDALGSSTELIEELMERFTPGILTRASRATHTQQSEKEVRQIKRCVDAVLFDLLVIG